MSSNNTLLTDDVGDVPEGAQPEGAQPENEAEGAKQAENTAPEEGGAAEKTVDVVPEQYDFKPPEGVEYDADTLNVYAEAAREAGLSQEKADLILNKLAPHLAQQQAEAMAQVREQWATDARADKEFGGDALPQNLALALKAMDKLGTPELKALLNDSGLGNHPEIIRVFYRAGKAMVQDGFVGGTKAVSGGGDARSHFPNSNMNP